MRFLLLLFVGLVAVNAVDYDWDDWTALDDYVHRDDGVYDYTEIGSYRYDLDNCTMYIYNMTSQRYQDENKVDKSIWWHFVGVAVPDNVQYNDAGFMLIDGGSNRESSTPPEEDSLENALICSVASYSGTVGGYVKQVPNQPIVFVNDPTQRSRSEDRLIAWTWRVFIDAMIKGEEPDPEIVLRMAMTKSAKRGLDTIANVASEKVPGSNIDRFLVTGASKRGWTTYSLAATDRRVKTIAPIVFSLLNFPDTLQHHFRSMDGGWSFALAPYFDEDLTLHLLDDDLFGPLQHIEDMFSYRSRFEDLPVLQIVGSSDEFFLCTDSHYWWDRFPAKKYLMMNENANHALLPAYLQIAETVLGYWSGYLQGWTMPEVDWHIQDTGFGGFIRMTTTPPAVSVTAWRAETIVNNTRRDFRLFEGADQEFQPVFWSLDLPVEDSSTEEEGRYYVEDDDVEGEWVGFFLSAEFQGPTALRMFLTSEVNVVPDTFPREPCTEPEDCYGKIV